MSHPVTPHTKNRRNLILSRDEFDYRTYQVTPSVIYAYMTKRPKSSYLTRPLTKVSSIPPSTGPTVGPGTYYPEKSEFFQTFQFPRCERFGSTDVNAHFIFSRKKSAEEKQKISERITKNIEIAEQPARVKKKSVNIQMKRKNFRAEVAKTVKKNLLEDKKSAQSELIRDKFKKLEYRLRLGV